MKFRVLLFSLVSSLLSLSNLVESSSTKERLRRKLQQRAQQASLSVGSTKPAALSMPQAGFIKGEASFALAKGIILQEHLMKLAEKVLSEERAVCALVAEQKKLLEQDNRVTGQLGERIYLESDPETPEAIAMQMRYGFILKINAREISATVSPLFISELKSDLPTYLGSDNSELQIMARRLNNKLTLAETYKDLAHAHKKIQSFLNTHIESFKTNPKLMPYAIEANMLMDGYACYLTVSKISTWITKLAYVIQSYESNREIIQAHYQSAVKAALVHNKKRAGVFPADLNQTLPTFKVKLKAPAPAKASSAIDWIPKHHIHHSLQKETLIRTSKKRSQFAQIDCASSSSSDDTISSRLLEKTSQPAQPDSMQLLQIEQPQKEDVPAEDRAISLSNETPTKADTNSGIKETATLITIEDPKNDAVIKLFKIDKPTAPNISIYGQSRNIQLWMENPDNALKVLGYTTVGHKNYNSPSDRTYLKKVHSFSQAVDDFVHRCGIVQEVASRQELGKKNLMILIPGAYSFDEGSKHVEKIGLFMYIIDPASGIIFHRMFHVFQARQLIEEYTQNGFWNVDMNVLHEQS